MCSRCMACEGLLDRRLEGPPFTTPRPTSLACPACSASTCTSWMRENTSLKTTGRSASRRCPQCAPSRSGTNGAQIRIEVTRPHPVPRSKQPGRLKLCSNGFIFEPDDASLPLTRYPLSALSDKPAVSPIRGLTSFSGLLLRLKCVARPAGRACRQNCSIYPAMVPRGRTGAPLWSR